jgi:hypothetical protein
MTSSANKARSIAQLEFQLQSMEACAQSAAFQDYMKHAFAEITYTVPTVRAISASRWRSV